MPSVEIYIATRPGGRYLLVVHVLCTWPAEGRYLLVVHVLCTWPPGGRYLLVVHVLCTWPAEGRYLLVVHVLCTWPPGGRYLLVVHVLCTCSLSENTLLSSSEPAHCHNTLMLANGYYIIFPIPRIPFPGSNCTYSL